MTYENLSNIIAIEESREVRKVINYDYSYLLGKMKERGFTQESLSKCIGISAVSLNLSLNNKRTFKQDEITKICETLNIPIENVQIYFFNYQLKIS